jgi:hypothetical protein
LNVFAGLLLIIFGDDVSTCFLIVRSAWLCDAPFASAAPEKATQTRRATVHSAVRFILPPPFSHASLKCHAIFRNAVAADLMKR